MSATKQSGLTFWVTLCTKIKSNIKKTSKECRHPFQLRVISEIGLEVWGKVT